MSSIAVYRTRAQTRRGIAFLVSSFALCTGALGCGGGAPEEGLEIPDGSAAADGSTGGTADGGGGTFDVGTGGNACKPRTCAEVGANCGPVADGCGALTSSCGTCSGGQVCGGRGTPSVCGTNVNDGGGCKPRTCAAAGASCGPIGDGCGGAIDCGTCASGTTCGGGGSPSVCGVKFSSGDGGAPGSACTPKKCSDYPGVNCGFIANGCGDVVDCGTCGVNELCGLAAPNVCAAATPVGGCVKKGCGDYPGVNCGPVSDGCGGFVECGTCTNPAETCGGGGTPSVCGNGLSGGSCVKKSCADYPNANCGYVADGCGDVVPCGNPCVAPLICGGAGVANQCGNPFATDAGTACKPKTCADQGFTCGQAGDGCGGVIASCGVCTSPAICGGGGVPSKCGGGTGDGGVVPGCTDPLCSQIEVCVTGETTITGTVRAPNGIEPLYNANVYIPKGTVSPFGATISCDRCDTPKPALVSAITGPDGKFTLKGAIPSGASIPLVIELGRWRRYTTINVTKCVTNTLTTAQTRLPRRQAEGNALDNIPRMALVTGNVDALECVLSKMGIEDVAFGNPTTANAAKRIQFYRDNGAYYNTSTPSYTDLVDNATTLRRFDAVLYACRGTDWTPTDARMQRLREYANEGGRLFATHWSFRLLRNDSEWNAAADWGPSGAATSGDLVALRSDVHTGFTKGAAFASWLGIVNALAVTSPPKVDILYSRASVNDVKAPTTEWISSPASAGTATTQHMTFNTPFTAANPANYCGRVIFSDFHVANGSTSTSTFPSHCAGGGLTDQEKILEFMLFDLASCVNGDNLPPPTPPTCTARTCADEGASCGQVANGCGGLTPVCGICPPGATCGGGGVANQCGGPTCVKTNCTTLGLSCGKASDGCSGTLDCGTCTVPGEVCGGGGVPGKCGAPTCNPASCASTSTSCGYIADGCGYKVYCGNCTTPGTTCGGGGEAGKCGAPVCPKKTCADYGASCGWVGDGCGGKTYCGDCTVPGSTCGGGGVPGVCGAPTTEPCKPRTCTDLNTKCGPAGDGCGGLLACGMCVAPETCGGGGVPGECGAPKCTKKTCMELGFECGPAADGCGGTLDCGMCVAPMTCGGGGVPNKCGGGPR